MSLLHPNFAARRPLPGALRHSQNHREAIERGWRLWGKRRVELVDTRPPPGTGYSGSVLGDWRASR